MLHHGNAGASVARMGGFVASCVPCGLRQARAVGRGGVPTRPATDLRARLIRARARNEKAPGDLPGAFALLFDAMDYLPAAPVAVALGLDGQPSADDVALGAQVVVGTRSATLQARRTQNAFSLLDVVVLIFDAEDHVDQRALVDHVVEAAAGIPAVVARSAVSEGNRVRRKDW